MRVIQAILAIGLLAIGLCAPAEGQDDRRWSPDRELYAVSESGQRVGKAEERERFIVYTGAGVQVAIAHVWLVEPDGTFRLGIRGCESWGWIDDSRLFCEGTVNPSTGVYLVFGARDGRELREFIGGHFVWSPDKTRLANYGNVPHFSPTEDKTDSLEIDGEALYPSQNDHERHWFRSELAWSADSRIVAVVDHRQADSTLWVVVLAVDGHTVDYVLPWTAPRTDWPPRQDVSLRWDKDRLVAKYKGDEHIVLLRDGGRTEGKTKDASH